MSKKNQLTYSVTTDSDYGYKRTHIHICERPSVDLVERLQKLLQKGSDMFSAETEEKKQEHFDKSKAELLELLKTGYSCYYDWNWDRTAMDITITFNHYTHNGEEGYGNPVYQRAMGFEHMMGMKRSIGMLEKWARAAHKRQYGYAADKGDMCLYQINSPRDLVNCLQHAKAVYVGRMTNAVVDRCIQMPEDFTFLGDDKEEEQAA